jgi:hypothetical protein
MPMPDDICICKIISREIKRTSSESADHLSAKGTSFAATPPQQLLKILSVPNWHCHGTHTSFSQQGMWPILTYKVGAYQDQTISTCLPQTDSPSCFRNHLSGINFDSNAWKNNHSSLTTLRASPVILTMRPCKSISYIQVWIFTFFQPHPSN